PGPPALFYRRIAGVMQRVGVKCLVRLAVPGHPSAEHFISDGNCPRTGFWHSAADHRAVGVEAVHMNIALNPALEIDAILFNLRPRFLEPGASEDGEIVPVGNPNASACQNRAVPHRADKADRL